MSATVRVRFGEGAGEQRGYDIEIGAGLLPRLGATLAELAPAHHYVVIADSRVGGLYGEQAAAAVAETGRAVTLLTFPEGEAHKTRESWAELSDRMLAIGAGRDTVVLALGGGVTGDLAGFVAATYLRGLPLIQLPTTLLAMIDSSVGGKTGVDTPAGKNLIGSFHQPRKVIADTDTLCTLEPRQVRAGLAEAIKHGAIADAQYFEWIAGSREALLALEPAAVADLIGRSVTIKADVVSSDEREGGLRKILNFGHTVGHAVEAASEFELLHGEAISIGMVVEARAGESAGLTAPGTASRLEAVFRSFELPVTPPEGLDRDRILALTRTDKKAREGRVEYTLIDRIGAANVGNGSYAVHLDDDVLRSALR